MRILLLAGIHANLSAFEAVLEDAKGKWDLIWFLGNVVGYGIEPNECIQLLQTLPHVGVTGIFDFAVAGLFSDLRTFNPSDRQRIEWTQATLKPEYFEFLKSFPITTTIGDYTLVHGAPRGQMSEYLCDPISAAINIPYLKTRYCFVGRLPRPAIYESVSPMEATRELQPHYSEPYTLTEQQTIIALGHVGISGTQTPQYAEYALLDTERNSFEYRRCLYDIDGLLQRLRAANVSQRLITTWEKGYF